ncbi:TetR/AcrR family transcriptional regulator [Nonomuraea sp. NPDC048916]|uniref:TetR/AcrR family transcriptional regulator n=1 Tax=Nonomuraea sp. NPDC048916 TaxID=3154232 RepID=UPI0033FE9CC8
MTGKQFTSVWLREPRKATSPGRSREEIVSAAMELLDAEGLDGLSMRKLGAKLVAGATSLYWYVANKDELLELVYDEVWGGMTVPDPEIVGWRDAAAAFAHNMRASLLRHSWATSLVGRTPALGPNALAAGDLMRRAFRLAGFEGLEIDYANATLTAYVFGMVIPEVAWNTAMVEGEIDEDGVRQAVAHAVRDYPDLIAGVCEAQEVTTRLAREMSFDFGLHSVLDGLEARLVT